MLFMYSCTIQLSGVMNELHIICGVTCLALSVADVPTLPVCATYKCTKLPI